jgi:hypothetical protein
MKAKTIFFGIIAVCEIMTVLIRLVAWAEDHKEEEEEKEEVPRGMYS